MFASDELDRIVAVAQAERRLPSVSAAVFRRSEIGHVEDGRFQAELVGGPVGRSISWFVQEAADRFRVAEGRERGEQLRVVRDESGAVVKLYFATYPVTRTPQTFGP